MKNWFRKNILRMKDALPVCGCYIRYKQGPGRGGQAFGEFIFKSAEAEEVLVAHLEENPHLASDQDGAILRIPMGQLLRYVHGGYGSVYERDQFITVKKGVTISTSVVVNGGVPGSDATEDAYAVHAMYTFASDSDFNGEPT